MDEGQFYHKRSIGNQLSYDCGGGGEGGGCGVEYGMSSTDRRREHHNVLPINVQ